MNGRDILFFGFTIEDLDRELIARGAQTPLEKLFDFNDRDGTPQQAEIFRQVKELYHPAPSLNPALSHIKTPDILQGLRQMIEEKRLDGERGIWGVDERMDHFDISDNRVRRNALSVAAVCMKNHLSPTGEGFQELRVKNYGETYTLCPRERFYDQPVAAGLMCTGVLVAPDVVATAAHFADETNVRGLRFLFGYVMSDPRSPVIRFPNKNVYHGVAIFHREYDVREPNASGSDWVLVRLDRKVEGREIAALSRRNVFYDQPLYVLGHPCGLPLKYAPGVLVDDIRIAYFMAQMDLYSGNSGSPVFCARTHEMVGMVARTDCRDFRRVKDCWVSVVYPNKKIKSEGDRCVKVSEFNEYIDRR
jgi:hypothetical protein